MTKHISLVECALTVIFAELTPVHMKHSVCQCGACSQTLAVSKLKRDWLIFSFPGYSRDEGSEGNESAAGHIRIGLQRVRQNTGEDM